jgi:catechol 2,3-dioxygenase-like lactoylglutathione lyase family enzyme
MRHLVPVLDLGALRRQDEFRSFRSGPGETDRAPCVRTNEMADTENQRPSFHWQAVCIDCADAEELAVFYSRLLGWEITARDTSATRAGGSGWIMMRDPSGGVALSFQAEEWYQPPVWPEEPEVQAKMLHFEIAVDDLEGAVAHVVATGGRTAPHQPADRDPARLRVMLDPAGHPFCLFTDE